MKIKYVILLLFLIEYFLPTSGFSLLIQENTGQEPNSELQATGTKGEDAIKARMLYRMAVWKWKHQVRRTTEMPKLDSTSVDAFYTSVKKGAPDTDPAGIHTVYNIIEEKLDTSYYSSSSKEVATAIEKTLKERYPKSVNSKEFISMLAYIDVLSRKSTNSPPKNKVASQEPIIDSNSNSKNTNSSVSAKTSDLELTNKGSKLNFIELHPYLSSLGGLFLGFLLGGVIVWLIRKKQQKYLDERISRRNITIDDLKNEIFKLKSEKASLEREKNNPVNLSKNSNDKELISDDKIPNLIEDSDQQLNSSYSPQPQPLALTSEPAPKVDPEKIFYAPAAEDPYIEQSKMYLTHSGAAAVMLTINPKNPDRAEFEFSPYADQAHIINTSITQLDQFFEYTLPSRGFSKIMSAGKGTLQLENGHWVRKTKARLELQ